MALHTLPYKYKITSKSVPAQSTDVQIVYDILDGTNATIVSSAKLNVNPTIPPIQVFDALRSAVMDQMLSDAGSAGAFLTAITNVSISVSQ